MQPSSAAGLTGKARESLAKVLEWVLEEEGVLLAATRDFRWQVTGPNLYSLHRLFDEQRRQLGYWVERVMEQTKLVGLRGKPDVETAPAVRPGMGPQHPLSAPSMLGELLGRHEAMARRLREDITRLPDPATADLLNHLMEFHETTAWMLRMVVTQNTGPDLVP